MPLRYVRPLLIRKFTVAEKRESTNRLTNAALQWYRHVEAEESDEDENDDIVTQHNTQMNTTIHAVVT